MFEDAPERSHFVAFLNVFTRSLRTRLLLVHLLGCLRFMLPSIETINITKILGLDIFSGAAVTDSLPVVTWLIKHGADCNEIPQCGWTLFSGLCFCVLSENDAVAETFQCSWRMSRGQDRSGCVLLILACDILEKVLVWKGIPHGLKCALEFAKKA